MTSCDLKSANLVSPDFANSDLTGVDLSATDITFGFDTALGIATEAIDRLHSTAHSHHRIIVVEIMGHNSGWLALGSGIAGGADVILIPEIPYSLELAAESIRQRVKNGKKFSIVAVAEGAMGIDEAKRIRKLEKRIQESEEQDAPKARKKAKKELKQIHSGLGDHTLMLARQLEKYVLVQVLDEHWRDHLNELIMLRSGIGLRSYGQRDPLVEYKKESYQMFQALMDRIDEEILRWTFLYQPVATPESGAEREAAEVALRGRAGLPAGARLQLADRHEAAVALDRQVRAVQRAVRRAVDLQLVHPAVVAQLDAEGAVVVLLRQQPLQARVDDRLLGGEAALALEVLPDLPQ